MCIQNTYMSEQLERMSWNNRRELVVHDLWQSLLSNSGLICWHCFLNLHAAHQSAITSWSMLVHHMQTPCHLFRTYVMFYLPLHISKSTNFPASVPTLPLTPITKKMMSLCLSKVDPYLCILDSVSYLLRELLLLILLYSLYLHCTFSDFFHSIFPRI